MKVSNVKVFLCNNIPRVHAFCNVVFDNVFVIRGIKIVEKPDGEYFVSYPNRESKKGEKYDIAHPIDNDFRIETERIIMNVFKHELELTKNE